mgnify:CR=1 FL=1|tara:strand:- start:447 stop:1664 length:1218 start_codon:yes stop_codon:yes gene_type:complete
MFKELKLIKLLVFTGLLFAIISKMDFNDFLVSELYTDKTSYYPGEIVRIYASTNFLTTYSTEIEITDFNKEIVSNFSTKIKNQPLSSKNMLSEGLALKDYVEYKIPDNFQSGVYLINGRFPLVVKLKTKPDITIVYPYANNVLYHSMNLKTVFSENLKMASLLRTTPIDKYTEGMGSFFEELKANYKTNFISDVDLENKIDTRLVIIYGKSSCWTPKMKSSLESFIEKGGNVLLITSYTLNNICWYDSEQQEIRMYEDSSIAMKSWYNYDSLNYYNPVGVSYTFGGYSLIDDYNVLDKKHPILKGINDSVIQFNGGLYSSPKVIWEGEYPSIKSIDLYKAEIVAYNRAAYHEDDEGIKGIFVLQRDSSSGKIVSLGTEDWCLKENFAANSNIQLITRNAVSYLLR